MNAFAQGYLEKKGYKINSNAYSIIQTADDWYRTKKTHDHQMLTVTNESYELVRMGFAKRAAADDANLCEVIEVNAGSNDERVSEILADNKFQTQYRKQLELTSAEGTTACYIRIDNAAVMDDGSIKGGEIRLNYIGALGFIPLTVINDEVIEAAFCGDTVSGTKETTTLVICTKNEVGNYQYETSTFDVNGNQSAPVTYELGEVKPFAVMRTAEVNSIEDMEGFGYPKVYGSIPVFLGLDSAFSSLLEDVDESRKITFINEQLCGFDDNGEIIKPNRELKKRFAFLGNKLPQKDTLIDTFTPNVRIDMFKPTIEMLLSTMGLKFGYGTKKYTFENGQLQTATQYIGERQDMMQELNKQRYQAVQYIQNIVKAALWFDNRFNGTAHNLDEPIEVEFDDSYIESKAEKLESYRQDALSGLGGVKVKALYLKEKYNLTDEEAAAWAVMEDYDMEEGG